MNRNVRTPVIGITCSMNDSASRLHANRSYFNAIWRSGGLPVFLPFNGEGTAAREFFGSQKFDAFLFSGGVDVNPARYGERVTADNVEICEQRDGFELELARILLYEATDVPVLGICRGAQLLNVAAGGTLYQDIPGHRQEEPGDEAPFEAAVTPGTELERILGSRKIRINSFHHQAVKDAAPGFRISALSGDGIPEAIEPAEKTERFFLAVQWHPELMFGTSDDSRKIFKEFIDAAARRT